MELKAYSGYMKDEQELLSCSSGGGAYVLSKAIINAGGVQYSEYVTLLTLRGQNMPV